MIITCPSCKRKYRIDERLLKPPYQKMRCSLCGHIFTYEQPVPEDDALPEMPAARRTRPAAGKKRKGGPLFVGIAALLVILAGLAYLYWANYMGASDKWLSLRNVEGQETVIANGKVFLIKGVIYNGSTKTRKYAILKARLFDESGKVIGEHFALAGLALSSDEARNMSGPEIEKKVADFRLSSLSAFVLYKNKAIPFSIVFPGTYTSKPKEFTVEIVEAPLL
jgi:predicted Zn finger-like uncharacterized protein